ncbi:MAG: cache domain-containing protein [Pseudomonadota bacterium]
MTVFSRPETLPASRGKVPGLLCFFSPLTATFNFNLQPCLPWQPVPPLSLDNAGQIIENYILTHGDIRGPALQAAPVQPLSWRRLMFTPGIIQVLKVRLLFTSIRSKLVGILVILGMIPLLFVGILAYETASEALLFQAREQLDNLAGKTAQQIDDFFMDLEKDIDLLSEYPFIQLAFLQFEFRQKLDTVQRVLTDYAKKNSYFNRIALVDLNGDTIISDLGKDQEPGMGLSREWFKAALEKGLHLSDIIFTGQDHTPRMILSKPVHDFEDREKKVGLLVFDIKLAAFTQFVSSLKIGEKGYAFLWDHKGYIVYHPEVRYRFNENLVKKGDDEFRNLLEKMSRGEKGFGRYALDGIRKNMFFTPCRTKNWSVGIAVETSKLMADILKLRQSMTTIISILCVLIFLASFLFIKSITRPINRLIQGARALGDGDLDHVITIDSGGEFFRLAQEFNSMSARLRRSMHEILELKTFNDDILHNVSSGIITVDRDNTISSFNRVAGTLLGLTQNNGVPEGSPRVEKVREILQHTLEKNQSAGNVELEFFNERDDSPVFMELNTSLLRNAAGDITGAIADIRDITRRKRIEEEMVRVEKLASLGELSAGMAHEIRNPLAGMKTSAQVLAKRLKTDEGRILVDGIIASIDRMNNTVTDLLNFSRPKPPCPAPWDLPQLIDLTLTMLRVKLRESGIDLVLDYGPDLPRAMIDKEQIQQVCINLILNALKAMPGGGALTISVRTCSSAGRDCLELCVADTGSGIRKEHMAKIFNPFFTSDPKGTGLGLAIVQKLLEKNKGSIHIDSIPGRGTRAAVLLPAVIPG